MTCGQKKYDVLSAVDVCVDLLVLDSPDPVFGQKEIMFRDYILEMGGSAAIFLSQCARLNLSALAIGKVGDDMFGDLFLERFSASGTDISGIEKDKHLKTGLGIALCRDNDRAILTYAGTIDGVSAEAVSSRIAECRHLHISSYYLMRKLRPFWPDILRMARKNEITVSLDGNWDPDEKWDALEMLQGQIDLLFVNEAEATAYTQSKNIHTALSILSKNLPNIIIKRGSQGAVSLCGDKYWTCRGFPGSPVDTVGAGDCFDAGYVYGWLNGLPSDLCLDIASFCGSESTREYGGLAGQPSAEQVRAQFPELQNLISSNNQM